MATDHRLVLVFLVGWACTVAAQPKANRSPRSKHPSPTTQPSAAEQHSDLRRFLNTKLDKVEYDDTPLEQVIAELREVGRANLVVRWRVLEKQGIERATTISLYLRDVTIAQFLSELLDQISVDVELGYVAFGNILRISTQEDLNHEMYVKVYEVVDIIHDIPDFKPDRWGALGAIGFGGGAYNDKTPEESINDLAEVIRASISPNVWRVNGGPATIRPFLQRVLVVRAPLHVHEKIGGPLLPAEPSRAGR
ncbi:MAG: hypothetical protein GY842_19440 [bacterium]|nr:hypothetical protein [bacterium]